MSPAISHSVRVLEEEPRLGIHWLTEGSATHQQQKIWEKIVFSFIFFTGQRDNPGTDCVLLNTGKFEDTFTSFWQIFVTWKIALLNQSNKVPVDEAPCAVPAENRRRVTTSNSDLSHCSTRTWLIGWVKIFTFKNINLLLPKRFSKPECIAIFMSLIHILVTLNKHMLAHLQPI